MGGQRKSKRSAAAAAETDQPLDEAAGEAVVPLCGFEWRGEVDGNTMETDRALFRRDALREWPNDEKEPEEATRTMSQSQRRIRYSDLPNLFREFANVEPTESGFLEFANRYGPLGLISGQFLPRFLHRPGMLPCRGEPYRYWLAEHRVMREAARLLDETAVRRSRSAAHRIERMVNDELSVYSRCGLVWNERRKRFTLKAFPVTLLGLMWWQVARSMTGDVEYKQCEQCERWIETGPDGHHASGKRFCSDACNQKHHRARVKQAKELKANGLSVSRIAKQLDTTPDVINHWLAKVK
ncbi:MAG: hypothetical protein U0791_24235 [Gemmataceae bacterium]